MPIGRKHNKWGVALDRPCIECGTFENLSRHHLKDSNGKKTGVVSILCRPCHDLAEEEYDKKGILHKDNPKYLEWLRVGGGDKKVLSRDNVTNDSLIPFHSRKNI